MHNRLNHIFGVFVRQQEKITEKLYKNSRLFQIYIKC